MARAMAGVPVAVPQQHAVEAGERVERRVGVHDALEAEAAREELVRAEDRARHVGALLVVPALTTSLERDHPARRVLARYKVKARRAAVEADCAASLGLSLVEQRERHLLGRRLERGAGAECQLGRHGVRLVGEVCHLSARGVRLRGGRRRPARTCSAYCTYSACKQNCAYKRLPSQLRVAHASHELMLRALRQEQSTTWSLTKSHCGADPQKPAAQSVGPRHVRS